MSVGELRPEVVVDEEGLEWVQIVDDAGFAGFDPTDEQVLEAVTAKYGLLQSHEQQKRLTLIAVTTAFVHEQLVADGQSEIAGFSGTRFAMRNKDVARAAKYFILSGPRPWRANKRTIEHDIDGITEGARNGDSNCNEK